MEVVVVQSLSQVWLFETPWTAAHQAPLSFIVSQGLLKLMSIEAVMPSNHLILCRPLLFLPSVFPSIRIFSNESTLRVRWPKYWRFSFSSFIGRTEWILNKSNESSNEDSRLMLLHWKDWMNPEWILNKSNESSNEDWGLMLLHWSSSPSNEYSGLISFRIDWFDLPAVQGTLRSLLQHHSSKASVLYSASGLILTSVHN